MLRALRNGVVICVWAWLGVASRAAALELSWSAPASCPAQSVVEDRLSTLLGTRESTLRARLKVEPHRGGYKLTLQLDGDGVRGTRVLQGPDCTALADTAAWLVATAIDPGIALAPPAPEPPAPEPPPPPPPAPPPPPRVQPPAPAPVSPWVLHAGVHGGLWHVLQKPPGQAAVGLGLGGSWRWLLAELRLDVGMPSESGIGQRGTVRASSQALGLAACGLWGSWLRAGPCLGVEAIRSHAEARNLAARNEGPSTDYWADVRAGAQIAARLGWPVELFLEGGVGTPVTARPRFRVTGATEALDAPRLSAYGRVGLRFRYPISPSARR